MSTTTDARVLRSKAKLREALLALLVEQRLETITIAEITQRAGIGYATFFRHYADRTALWHDVADEVTIELLARLAILLDEADSLAMAQAFCSFVDSNHDRLRALLGHGAEGALREDLVRRAAAMTSERTAKRVAGLPRDLAMIHATNASIGIVTWWLDHRDSVGVDELATIVDRLVITPLRARPPA